ncbi:MAG: hypothetical protein M1831_004102 [Alyxoria varia]|nr:MAG: hypothetical protein M1831_004102 [Alyxoria varia]
MAHISIIETTHDLSRCSQSEENAPSSFHLKDIAKSRRRESSEHLQEEPTTNLTRPCNALCLDTDASRASERSTSGGTNTFRDDDGDISFGEEENEEDIVDPSLESSQDQPAVTSDPGSFPRNEEADEDKIVHHHLDEREATPAPLSTKDSFPPHYRLFWQCTHFEVGEIIKFITAKTARDKNRKPNAKGVFFYRGSTLLAKSRPFVITRIYPNNMVVCPVYSHRGNGWSAERVMITGNGDDRFNTLRLQLANQRSHEETLPESRILECSQVTELEPLPDTTVHLDFETIQPNEPLSVEGKLMPTSIEKLKTWLKIWDDAAEAGSDITAHTEFMRKAVVEKFEDDHEKWWAESDKRRMAPSSQARTRRDSVKTWEDTGFPKSSQLAATISIATVKARSKKIKQAPPRAPHPAGPGLAGNRPPNTCDQKVESTINMDIDGRATARSAGGGREKSRMNMYPDGVSPGSNFTYPPKPNQMPKTLKKRSQSGGRVTKQQGKMKPGGKGGRKPKVNGR